MRRWAQAPFPLARRRVRVATAAPAREGSVSPAGDEAGTCCPAVPTCSLAAAEELITAWLHLPALQFAVPSSSSQEFG